METEAPAQVLARHDLSALFDALRDEGRRVVGPTHRDGAIVYDTIDGAGGLPVGLRDEQAAGTYRLRETADERLFGYTCGPGSAKRFLHPPEVVLFRARKVGERLQILPETEPAPKLAFIGLRACDLAAIAIQDRVFLHSAQADPRYASRRAGLFVVAIQCDRAAATCFCDSMGTGPRLSSGYDLALTEVLDDAGHRFVVQVGSQAGAALADRLPLAPIGPDADAPNVAAENARQQQTRRLGVDGLRERLLAALRSPAWDAIAERCVGCANCTMVCPTCFCTDVADVTDLGGVASRVRRWDSCFNPDHSQLHGQPVRRTLSARYRQWLTHKLATWYDQFGTSGCVGCGRCVTWCPAGIDLVAEANRIAGREA